MPSAERDEQLATKEDLALAAHKEKAATLWEAEKAKLDKPSIDKFTGVTTHQKLDELAGLPCKGPPQWEARVRKEIDEFHKRLFREYHEKRSAATTAICVNLLQEIMPRETAEHILKDANATMLSQRLLGWAFVHEKREHALTEYMVLTRYGQVVAETKLEGFASDSPQGWGKGMTGFTPKSPAQN